MECKPEKLTQDIDQKKLSPVNFFYGPEELLKEEAVQSIIQQLDESGLRDFNLDILYGDETDAAQIIDRVSSLPMMGEKRVVVVRNINELALQDRRSLLEYLQAPSAKKKLSEHLQERFEHVCLIMTAHDVDTRKGFYRDLKKVVNCVNFILLKEKEILEWVQQRAKKYGKSIDTKTSQLLCDSVGNNTIALDNELQKLAIYIGERTTIDAQAVTAVVGELRVHTVFEFCDTIASGSLGKAMALLTRLLEAGITPFHLMGTLRWRLSCMARERGGRRRGSWSGRVVPGTAGSGKGSQQSADLSERDLERMFAQLYETELNLKSGRQKPKTAMTLLVYKLCRPRGNGGNEQR
ncbi:DNA polymerase III subunit delta [bacterium]|nr:DNA polymerase III subunit delta [bacterium]